MPIQRRSFLGLAPFAFAQPVTAQQIPPAYPSHPAELAREMVGASHGKIARVRELVKAQPSLAKASWDWGFGDWETALGAASHVGARAIAELLIENGAPPTLCSATMMGQLEIVKSIVAANPGVQRLPGPHSISLLAHAKAGGEPAKAVHQYLESLGDADGPGRQPLTENNLTSLAGVYTFGAAATDRIEIASAKGQIQFQRAGAHAIRLFHLGDLIFHPAGASAVRINFDGKGALTIQDGSVIVTARRTD